MEGFLLKKGRGESKMFGRRNWKKRWCVLEGQYFTYYEDFDRDKNIPINKKGVAPIRGCEITIVPHQEKKFCFVVKHENRQPLFLCAEKEKLMHVWMKALESAAKGITGPTTFNFDEYYEILSLNKSEELTVASLNKAYRKAALKNHPDKGGNVDAFKKIQEAFEILQSKVEEDEQSKLYKEIRFTAEIVKGPPGIGFGMVVVEDTKKGAIIAKEILPVMILRSISDEANGGLQKGDRIIGIDNDDITTWTLARVVQRLNDFRAPVDTSVNFTFSRKVKLDGDDDNNNDNTNNDDDFNNNNNNQQDYQDNHENDRENHYNNDRRRGQSQETNNNDHGDGDGDEYDDMEGRDTFRNSGFSNNKNEYNDDNDETTEEIPSFHYEKRSSNFTTDYASADIDEDDYIPPPVPPSNSHSQPQPQYTSEKPKNNNKFSNDYASADIDEDDYVPPPVPPSQKNSHKSDFASIPKETSQPKQSSTRSNWDIDPMVQMVSLKAENDDLQAEVERLNHLVNSLTKERDFFQQEANEYKMRYEDAESERLDFLKQLSEVESECEQLERRERDALKLLEKLSEQGQLSSQQSAEIENNVRLGARAAQNGELLSDVSQSHNWGSIEYAQQAAIKAVSYVDSSGQFQEKFTQHEIGKNFLKKLEDSVLRQYGNSSAYNSNETDDEEGDNREYYTSPNYSHNNNNNINNNRPEEYLPPGNNIKSQQNRLSSNSSLPNNTKQRSGTQLYQSHKSNLRPVNRPSMEKARANTMYSQSPPNGNKSSQSNSNLHHSPIKTSSNEYYDNHIDDNRRTTIKQSRSSGHQMESRLFQQTASSTNRISRTSDVNRNSNPAEYSNNIQQQPVRNRSPRRSDPRGGNRTSKNAIYD